MTKRTFSPLPTTPRVLAVALLALTGVAHAQKSAPRELPPYLPPESSVADLEANADAKPSDAKSDAPKTSSPRVLAPRDDAQPEAERAPAAKTTATAAKKASDTTRSQTAKTVIKAAASTRSGAAAPTPSIAPATVKAPKRRALNGGDDEPLNSVIVSKSVAPTAATRAMNGAATIAARGAAPTFSASALPPAQLQFRQLGEGWQRITIVAPTLAAAPDDASTRGTKNVVAQRIARLYGGESGVFFTRGETRQTGSETFLALYKMRVGAAEIAALFPKSSVNTDAATRALTAFFANRPLELSLVNVRSIGAMQDIKSFSQAAQTAQLRAILGGVSTSPGVISPGATLPSVNAPAASTRGSAYYASLARTNLLRLGGAIDLYARAHGGTLPPLQSSAIARKSLLPYAGRLAFNHPAPNATFRFNPILSGRKIVHIAKPRDMISAYEVPPSGAKRAVLFLDGTVRFLDAAQWRKYSRGSKIK